MSRFYVPKESIKESLITISGREAHHIIDVMRLKAPDKVVTFDGTGKEYIGFIKEVTARSAVIEIVETRALSGEKSLNLTLIQAIPKKDKMDYIVEKSTELGVSKIIPLFTERTIPNWDEPKKAASVERWRRIAMEASKQCGRADIPGIDRIKSFSDITADMVRYDLALIAALDTSTGSVSTLSISGDLNQESRRVDDGAIGLKDALEGFGGGAVVIAIGPEGDFTPDEIKEAKDGGFKLINLGSRVLKSDTAGLFVLAILNYELSN